MGNAKKVVQFAAKTGLVELQPVKHRVFQRVLIVGLTAARLAESGTFVESSRRLIRLANLQKYRLTVIVFRYLYECIQELSRNSLSLRTGCDNDVFQFPFGSDLVGDEECDWVLVPDEFAHQKQPLLALIEKVPILL